MKKTGYLGIDVSKGYADFLLLGNDSQVLEEGFQLTDSKEGRRTLKSLITGWQASGITELYCGVESTGGYENNWYDYLRREFKEKQVWVCRINPKGVKSVGEASLKRTITDAVSAENIATYLIGFSQKLDYGINREATNEGFREGRQHLTFIKMQQKQKVQLTNQLEKLLYQYLAEVLVYCRHGIPGWLLNLLTRYPTPAAMIKAGTARLAALNGISKEKAAVIINKVKESEQPISQQVAHIIMVTAKEILHKDILIKDEKTYLCDLYQDSEEVVLLRSIIGIGTDSAIAIALEIEDIEKFDDVKKMSAFFGVHPTFKQSGDSTWGNHMSKKGRGEIRAILYMASLSAVRFNPVLKQVYARSRAKGMVHRQAAGVVMHKLLRIIYGILKNKTAFDVDIDDANQKKAKEKQENNEQAMKGETTLKKQKKHRFQPLTTNAPISKRAEQRIKKQAASQTSS